MEEEIKKPKYEFVPLKEGEVVSPVKRQIAKTMQVTENFNVFDTMQYLAKMKKAVEDKKAEVIGLEKMVEAYQAELDLIESILGVQEMDKQYQKEIAEKQEEVIESPYVEVVETDEDEKENN